MWGSNNNIWDNNLGENFIFDVAEITTPIPDYQTVESITTKPVKLKRTPKSERACGSILKPAIVSICFL